MDRDKLLAKLGGWPEPTLLQTRPAPLQPVLPKQATARHVTLQLTRPTAHWPGDPIPLTLIKPDGPGPFPCILYIHAHGFRYQLARDELWLGRPSLQGPYGPDLIARGFAVAAIDLPCFGSRQHHDEEALAKRLLWRGDTLFGTMLRELATALDFIGTLDEIDPTRIAALGFSMGATLAWWLAALDQRVSAVVNLCCFADLQTLIDLDHHGLHGHYMTVPGLLPDHPTLSIASMIAPRPHLACVGALDPLTPKSAYQPLADGLNELYRAHGAAGAFELFEEPDQGHVETGSMRNKTLEFLSHHLRTHHRD